MRNKVRQLFSLVLGCAVASPALAIQVGQLDDFESGLAGWRVGGGGGNPIGPKVVEDGGSQGPFLNYVTDSVNTGGRFLILNSSQWTGDYHSAGVRGVQALARNDGEVDLSMRLLLEGRGGGFFSQHAQFLPVGGDWQMISFPISVTDLVGGDDLLATLSAVEQVRIFHNPEPMFPGPVTQASISIDSILAVPEPTTIFHSLFIVFVMLVVRSRRTARSS